MFQNKGNGLVLDTKVTGPGIELAEANAPLLQENWGPPLMGWKTVCIGRARLDRVREKS